MPNFDIYRYDCWRIPSDRINKIINKQMKNIIFSLLCFCVAFANIQAQEFPKPTLASPEATFYTYLDNENISDPSKYNGNVKRVIRTYKEYENGVDAVTIEKTTMFVNQKGEFHKTITRTYSFGIEDSKQEINHLEEPKSTIEIKGNQTIKIVKQETIDEELEYGFDLKGDEKYVYKNDRLVAYYNNNDSISYAYDAKDRLIEIKTFESLVAEDYNDEDGSITYYRSTYEDKALERITYENDMPAKKIIYDKFGEVIDIYKKTYTYSKGKLLESFKTEYKRYLFDYYVDSIAIDKQMYSEFPKVEMNDSIQKGTFLYSPTQKIQAYKRTKGEEKEGYKILYDKNDRMQFVEGTLEFYQRGKLVKLEAEYEYLYDEKGNPKSIRSYYYIGGEKILHKETTFEIEYY